jgi:hypothetical protein
MLECRLLGFLAMSSSVHLVIYHICKEALSSCTSAYPLKNFRRNPRYALRLFTDDAKTTSNIMASAAGLDVACKPSSTGNNTSTVPKVVSWICHNLGAITSISFVSLVSDHVGRRWGIILRSIIMIIGSIMESLTWCNPQHWAALDLTCHLIH